MYRICIVYLSCMYRVYIVINSGLIGEIYAAYKLTTTHRIYLISQKKRPFICGCAIFVVPLHRK